MGQGTYGVVYKAMCQSKGITVALKKIHMDRGDEGIPQTALREISVLQELKHPNLVQLLDVVHCDGSLYLVFEFVESDLKKTLEKNGPFTGLALKKTMYQLVSALAYCHANRVAHRDLKPANILISDTNKVKLADFGLARAFQIPIHTYTHEVVTLWYRAPEILLGEKHYTPAIDIWSLGCIFAELARGKVFLKGDCEIGQLFEIFKVFGLPKDTDDSWPGVSRLKYFNPEMPNFEAKPLEPLFESLNADGCDLLKRMMVYCPLKRITPKEALLHPWFADVCS